MFLYIFSNTCHPPSATHATLLPDCVWLLDAHQCPPVRLENCKRHTVRTSLTYARRCASAPGCRHNQITKVLLHGVAGHMAHDVCNTTHQPQSTDLVRCSLPAICIVAVCAWPHVYQAVAFLWSENAVAAMEQVKNLPVARVIYAQSNTIHGCFQEV